MKRGYIKLWRKIQEHEDHPLQTGAKFSKLEAWIDMIMLANGTDKEWRGILIKRGDFISSYQKLATRWKWSKSMVVRFFAKKKERNEIGTVSETKSERSATRITIMKYDIYNPSRNGERNEIGTVSETKSELTNEVKKFKELKKKKSTGKNSTEFSPSVFKLVDFSIKEIHNNHPHISRSSNDKLNFADMFDKLIRIDGKTEKEIEDAIIFAVNHKEDNFSWAEQFQSPLKLRKKNKEGIKYIDVWLSKVRKVEIDRIYNPGRQKKPPVVGQMFSLNGHGPEKIIKVTRSAFFLESGVEVVGNWSE